MFCEPFSSFHFLFVDQILDSIELPGSFIFSATYAITGTATSEAILMIPSIFHPRHILRTFSFSMIETS